MKGHQKMENWTSRKASKAQMKAMVVTGMTVNAPTARGRPMRLRRCAAQGAQSPALPEQRGEVAAEQEEDGHSEAVDGEEEESVEAGDLGGIALGGVGFGPGVGHEEERGVENDAEEHGEGAEGVELVEALGGSGVRRGIRPGERRVGSGVQGG